MTETTKRGFLLAALGLIAAPAAALAQTEGEMATRQSPHGYGGAPVGPYRGPWRPGPRPGPRPWRYGRPVPPPPPPRAWRRRPRRRW